MECSILRLPARLGILRSQAGRLSIATLSLLFGLGIAGCGTDPDNMLAEMNNSNIKRVANIYAMYQFKNQFKGPRDEAALRKFIDDQNPQQLERIGVKVAQIDQLFRSERDKQEFKIRWGIDTVARGPSDPVVFESEGVNGIRHIAFTGGELVEADNAQYDRLWSGEGSIEETQRPDGLRPRR